MLGTRPRRKNWLISAQHMLLWNVRRFNSKVHRSGVKELILHERASIVCLQEIKLETNYVRRVNESVGLSSDYCFLVADGVSGGILIALILDVVMRKFSISCSL